MGITRYRSNLRKLFERYNADRADQNLPRMSQQALADQVGLTRATINRWMQPKALDGYKIDDNTITVLRKFFGVTKDELLTEVKDEPSSPWLPPHMATDSLHAV